ncbi:MAG: 30S ribosomal protein S20 [Bdellovibrionales bacterium]|nr:30S ribosomal protein S20 [Bdellovibrionales bacterium]
MANDTAPAAGGAKPKKKLVKGRHLSAIKRARQSLKRQARNSSWSSRVKTFEKKLVVAIQNKDTKVAKDALVEFMSQIDKAAQRGAVHVKRAARRISSLSKQVANIK